jgi:hypothetical protein
MLETENNSKPVKLNEEEEFIVSYMKNHNDIASVPELQKDGAANGLDSEKVRKYVYSLVKKELVKRINTDAPNGTPAVYQLTAAGLNL